MTSIFPSKIYRRNLITIALLALLFIVFIPTTKTHAAYEAGRLIDDQQLLDARSMSIGDIQQFFVARNSGLKSMSFEISCFGQGSKERQLYISAGAKCDIPVPASEVIYYASQIYGINPKVVLAKIQKEQSLATAPNPTSWQLNQAMGYGCPTQGGCGASNFAYQIDSGTWALRKHYERANRNMNWWVSESGWACGGNTKYRKPTGYPHQNISFYDEGDRNYATIYVENAATASFYCFTPHAYNNFPGCIAAWSVSYTASKPVVGSTGNCYSGSYNFVYFYELWFGTTKGFGIRPQVAERYNSHGSMGLALDSGFCNTSSTVCWQEFRSGFIMYSSASGAWESKGSIREYWGKTGYQNGKLGFPIDREVYAGNGLWWQQYQNGFIIGSDKTGYWDSAGKIRERWGALGYQSSQLGLPIDSLVANSGGSGWQQYQNGFIIGSDKTGYWESKGAIRSFWQGTGYQAGMAGWPIGPELYDKDLKTWSQVYEKGSIFYSDARGGWFEKKI